MGCLFHGFLYHANALPSFYVIILLYWITKMRPLVKKRKTMALAIWKKREEAEFNDIYSIEDFLFLPSINWRKKFFVAMFFRKFNHTIFWLNFDVTKTKKKCIKIKWISDFNKKIRIYFFYKNESKTIKRWRLFHVKI